MNADSILVPDLEGKRVFVLYDKEVYRQIPGAIFTQDPCACWQTITIDLTLIEHDEYEFSL